MRHVVALGLGAAGSAALVLAALALVVLRGPYGRLHALACAGTLGAPLAALGVAVEVGPGRAAVKVVVIGVLLAAGGTVTTMAIGRATVVARDAEELRAPRGAHGRGVGT
jgi:multicomponent Na+:H+ antiporter subunit G